jgi:hypothetical protein
MTAKHKANSMGHEGKKQGKLFESFRRKTRHTLSAMRAKNKATLWVIQKKKQGKQGKLYGSFRRKTKSCRKQQALEIESFQNRLAGSGVGEESFNSNAPRG